MIKQQQQDLFTVDFDRIDFDGLRRRFAEPKSRRIGLSDRCISCIVPPPRVRTWDWISEHVYTPDGTPFNPLDYPYCEGVCDAWDDPRIRLIVLQWSARVGKTLLSLALMTSAIALDPVNAMFSTATEKLCRETIADKYYPMFEKCKETRDWVPPPNRRVTTKVDLRYSKIYGAWSGSVAALADKDPKRKHAGEIDKWTDDQSDEADSFDLFMERGAERPDRKTIAESTPTKEGKSRINRLLLMGTNSRLQVPCPFCGGHQQLVVNTGNKREGGLIWDTDGDGKSSPTLAQRTARYRCAICTKEFGDEYRKPAIRRGIWVPSGCYVDDRARLAGTPTNEGDIASFQLSRLNAPTFGFGRIAAKHVEVEQSADEKRQQNYDNSWLGITHKSRHVVSDWEKIAERIAIPIKFAHVPNWTAFVTLGVDVQVDYFVFAVCAWGPYGRGHLVDYDTCDNWSDLRKICGYAYPYADSPAVTTIRVGLADARDGNRMHEVIDGCRSLHDPPNRKFYPALGERSNRMSGQMFRRMEPGDRDRKKRSGKTSRRRGTFTQIMVNKGWYETWIHNCLFTRSPSDNHSLSISTECADDQDLFEQLLNVRPNDRADRSGHYIREWSIINEDIPRDFRDAVRLARCAADVQCRGVWRRVKRRM